MMEISSHMWLLIVIGVALSIVIAGILMTRLVDKEDPGTGAGPQAEPGGKTIVLGGKTYGLHTAWFSGVSEHWVLSLPVGAAQTFSVQREDGLERLIEHLGVMAKVSTGDARFDEEFEVRSHDAPWTQTFFSDPENRRLVHALFGLDSSTIILSKGLIQACFEEHGALAEGGPALSDLAARLTGA